MTAVICVCGHSKNWHRPNDGSCFAPDLHAGPCFAFTPQADEPPPVTFTFCECGHARIFHGQHFQTGVVSCHWGPDEDCDCHKWRHDPAKDDPPPQADDRATDDEANVYGEGNTDRPDFNVLLDSWESEIDEHTKADEYGIAEGLRVAMNELTAFLAGRQSMRGEQDGN